MKTFKFDSRREAMEFPTPETYFFVENLRSGEIWITPLRGNALLSLKVRVKEWIKNEFCGDGVLDGEITPLLEGEYYATIKTDSRPIDSVVCWTGGGFYVKFPYNY